MEKTIKVELTREEIERISEWLDVLIDEDLATDEDMVIRHKLEEYL